MPSKQTLRAEGAQARDGAPGPDLEPVLAELLSTAHRVASFVGVRGEPHVPPRSGWLLPVLLDDGDLDWAAYDGTLRAGRHGVPEPTTARLGVGAIADCDVVLVPALLVDLAGFRLGKGGGSYDRALARANGLTVALLGDDEVVPRLPREPHDVPVRAFATPAQGLVLLGPPPSSTMPA